VNYTRARPTRYQTRESDASRSTAREGVGGGLTTCGRDSSTGKQGQVTSLIDRRQFAQKARKHASLIQGLEAGAKRRLRGGTGGRDVKPVRPDAPPVAKENRPTSPLSGAPRRLTTSPVSSSPAVSANKTSVLPENTTERARHERSPRLQESEYWFARVEEVEKTREAFIIPGLRQGAPAGGQVIRRRIGSATEDARLVSRP